MVPISVLDLFPVSAGTPPTAALRASIALAQRVDELGYSRYWIAEHHNIPSIASSAPEVLVGHVAGLTRRIRVGAGGMMLPNHAPLHVLEVFRTLEALYPGRIDLGIGRAPGTDPVTSEALRRRSSAGGDVNDQIAELFDFATHRFPADHPFRAIDVMPSDACMPPIWMLGSTRAGARIAASHGVGFAFAGHFSMGEAKDAIVEYRARFTPRNDMPRSRLIMAVSVVCGESDEHAIELARPLRVAYARLAAGRPGPFPSVEEARDHRFSKEELAVVDRFSQGAIVGSPASVGAGLERLIDQTSADELMISTVVPIHGERVASYERVAQVCGLDAAR
ncbi:MAG: LLM class flavin-dependent oxidoreductase [Polyangiaceae bacterium]|jgi:luciferase family oxidoreductase group 1